MLSNIIYILATTCLFVGSIMTFKKELPDYFYMAGTSLFLVKSLMSLYEDLNKKKKLYLYRDIL